MKKLFTSSRFQELALEARLSDRRRMHLNAHDSLDADVQRLFIATSPDTYIRPHRHSEPHKWEFFVILEGRMDLVVFDDDGVILERCRLSPDDTRAVEIPPGVWHSYVCCEVDTIALEVKQGAYAPTAGDDLAPWAPVEKAESCRDFLTWMRTAAVGSSPP